jgi:hypothetical protein
VATVLRGDNVLTRPKLRSLVWVLAELAGVDPEATTGRFDQLWERVAHDISALSREQALRRLQQLGDDNLYPLLSTLPEDLRNELIAALPPEKRPIYERVYEETKRSLQALAEALMAMPPERAAEMLKQQDPGKVTSILYFMGDEERMRILTAMGLEETAKFVCRELISLSDSDPDQVAVLLESSDLYVFGLGLCLLDPPDSERLRGVLGPERSARALTAALTRFAQDEKEPAAAPVAEKGALGPVELWDRLEEFVLADPAAIDRTRELEIWLGPAGQSGHRLGTPFGEVDFLCADRGSGALVVVKLRRDQPAETLFGQVVGLIGYTVTHLAGHGQRVEGIIVTDVADEKLTYLSAGFPGLRIMTYSLEFRLTAVGSAAD